MDTITEYTKLIKTKSICFDIKIFSYFSLFMMGKCQGTFPLFIIGKDNACAGSHRPVLYLHRPDVHGMKDDADIPRHQDNEDETPEGFGVSLSGSH